MENYRVGPEYTLYVPSNKCWADCPNPSYVAMSEHILKVGGTIPLHLFFVTVLNYFDLAPLQLAPNS